MELFQYSFMIRALIAGCIIAITAPLVGTFLVTRRYSLMADTLSHVSLAGIAIGLLLNIYPVYTALIISVIAALLIEKLSNYKRITGESTLSVFLSGGLALAIVLISLARGFNVDLYSYLFGSITTVSVSDLYLISIVGIVVSIIIFLLYDRLMYVSFDEESARVSGLSTKKINYIFMVLTAITIALSTRIVGVLLVSALMVVPVLTASQVARSFKQSIFYSILFSLFFVVSGLILSYYFNIAAGGAIVLFSIVCFGLILSVKNRG
jgi:zinc transport system permease protein